MTTTLYKRCPYKTLGVSKYATKDEIRSAYLKKIKLCHPDSNPNDKTLNSKFVEIQDAYSAINADNRDKTKNREKDFERAYVWEDQEHSDYASSEDKAQTKRHRMKLLIVVNVMAVIVAVVGRWMINRKIAERQEEEDALEAEQRRAFMLAKKLKEDEEAFYNDPEIKKKIEEDAEIIRLMRRRNPNAKLIIPRFAFEEVEEPVAEKEKEKT